MEENERVFRGKEEELYGGKMQWMEVKVQRPDRERNKCCDSSVLSGTVHERMSWF